MKANEAPDKIHIQPNAHDRWFEGDIPNGLPGRLFVEYTRTDAFIEKACLWLSNVSIEDMTYKYNDFDTSEGWYKLIENFKNYMKGK